MQAVNPAPDGGYPGGNTARDRMLFLALQAARSTRQLASFVRGVTTGSFNTGIGAGTLLANTADENTAIGAGALLSNTTGDRNTAKERSRF